jgi:hypothetical protein
MSSKVKKGLSWKPCFSDLTIFFTEQPLVQLVKHCIDYGEQLSNLNPSKPSLLPLTVTTGARAYACKKAPINLPK